MKRKTLIFILILLVSIGYSIHRYYRRLGPGWSRVEIVCPQNVKTSDYDHAIELYRKALLKDPRNARLLSGYALTYAYKIEAYQMLCALKFVSKVMLTMDFSDDRNLRIFNDPAVKKAYLEAIESAMAARKLDPLNPQAPHALGHLLMLRGRSRDAIKQLEEAQRLDPANLRVYVLKARIYKIMPHDKKRALSEIRTALQIDPDDPQAKFLYKQLRGSTGLR